MAAWGGHPNPRTMQHAVHIDVMEEHTHTDTRMRCLPTIAPGSASRSHAAAIRHSVQWPRASAHPSRRRPLQVGPLWGTRDLPPADNAGVPTAGGATASSGLASMDLASESAGEWPASWHAPPKTGRRNNEVGRGILTSWWPLRDVPRRLAIRTLPASCARNSWGMNPTRHHHTWGRRFP